MRLWKKVAVKIAERGSYRIAGLTATLLAATWLFAAADISGATPALPVKPPQTRSHPSLCESTSTLVELVVRRIDAFPENHFVFSFPPIVSISDPVSVQKAARALCALPTMPSGIFACPADFGISYQLSFSTRRYTFPSVSAEPTGCEIVKGLGPERWTAQTPAFWRTLGEAMRLTKPDRRTFAGSMPKG
jgi:hypothetical protein